ncbi:MAG: hypothetical protein K2Y23_06685 [Cyanobacteria bacterium]|nr:hypothetical protein [Cyanobacteriota bacterium]
MLRHTTLIEFRGFRTLAGYTTAVSLHAHTNRSKERVTDVPRYLERIPLVASFVRREIREYAARNGLPIDFTKGWWHPPVSSRAVLASERSQICRVLGLTPLVSITDHDTIQAGLELQREHPCTLVPVSLEWTVPFHRGFFHLGVHNLRPESAPAVVRSLSEHWSNGGPLWVRCAMRAFQLGASAPLRPLLAASVRLAGASTPNHGAPAAIIDASAPASGACT